MAPPITGVARDFKEQNHLPGFFSRVSYPRDSRWSRLSVHDHFAHLRHYVEDDDPNVLRRDAENSQRQLTYHTHEHTHALTLPEESCGARRRSSS
ncbi:hypothetical protein MTO96_017566 [Rhipicephalus appendiculatus]